MNRKIVGMALIILLLGAAIGYWLAPRQPAADSKDAVQSDKRKPLFYRNPMNPSITSPVPAKDSMGMDYIPVYEDDAAGKAPPGTVKIDPTIVQNIGVRTTRAEKRTLSKNIRTVGRVDFDEARLARLHPKTNGWIEKLFVDKTGEQVKKDTILLSLYSPQLVASEEEYILALNNYDTLKNSPFADIRKGAKRLMQAARERLVLLDVPEHQIREIEASRKIKKELHIHSPFDGVVVRIGVREGQHVSPANELYAIADLSRVWVYADLYEFEIPWVREGDEVRLKLSALPGREFRGRITYIYPYLDAKTRTNKVRMEFDNREGLLKPDMFADAAILASKKHEGIAIPAEAILRTGRAEHVFVQTAPGTFEPRQVRLGISSNGWVEVKQGVRQGELVVTSAQFLIDSESSIREAAAKMMKPGQKKMKKDHKPKADDMDMSGMKLEPGKKKRQHKHGSH